MHLRVILLISALIMSSTSFAQGFRIQLGSETARFMYFTEAFGQDFGRLELEAGGLYNEDDDYLFNLGLLVRGESISVPMVVAVGARAYYATLSSGVVDYNVGAIGIGGEMLLTPDTWGGVGLGLSLYKAPSVVSFDDAEGLLEYSVFLNYQITPQAMVFIGYQKIEADIENVSKIEVDAGGYFGIDIQF